MSQQQWQPENTDQPWTTYQKIIASDRVQAPSDIMAPFTEELGIEDSDRSMYYDPAFHRLEMDRLWSRTWQVACRAEEVPEPGDVHVYEIGDWSFLIVRNEDGSLKAFRNSCTHRGTKLCAEHSSLQKIRCPFHGLTWNLDGSINELPGRWDFPQASDDTHRLSEVRLGEWGGFVFINPDDNAESLESYLGELPAHLEVCNFENMYIHGYYRKIMPSNWKGALEAFLEAWHGSETHSQTRDFSNDCGTQYDFFPDSPHISRFLQPIGVTSPNLGYHPTEQEIVNNFFRTVMNSKDPAPALPEGMTARQFIAEVTRDFHTSSGRDVSQQSDAELIDAIQYTLFPNIVLFRSVGFPVVYRFRPNKHDPDSSIFDMYILHPVPADGRRPLPAEAVDMGDMTYSEIPELAPWLGEIYDQDVGNLALLQQGLKADTKPVTISRYMESRIRYFHQTLRRYLAKE